MYYSSDNERLGCLINTSMYSPQSMPPFRGRGWLEAVVILMFVRTLSKRNLQNLKVRNLGRFFFLGGGGGEGNRDHLSFPVFGNNASEKYSEN